MPTVPAGENTPTVQGLMQLLKVVLEENDLLHEECAMLTHKSALLAEQVALLRDEVAIFKGHKPRPKSRAAT